MVVLYAFFGISILYVIYFIANIVYIKRYGIKITGKVVDNKVTSNADGLNRYIALIQYTNTLGEEGVCKVRTSKKSSLNTTFELVEYKNRKKTKVVYMIGLLEQLYFLLFLMIMLGVAIIIELS
jgi:hypothetical protein